MELFSFLFLFYEWMGGMKKGCSSVIGKRGRLEIETLIERYCRCCDSNPYCLNRLMRNGIRWGTERYPESAWKNFHEPRWKEFIVVYIFGKNKKTLFSPTAADSSIARGRDTYRKKISSLQRPSSNVPPRVIRTRSWPPSRLQDTGCLLWWRESSMRCTRARQC